jgi:hypothetical protein
MLFPIMAEVDDICIFDDVNAIRKSSKMNIVVFSYDEHNGRFIIIVDREGNSLYKAQKMDDLLGIPFYQLFST